MQSQNSAPVAQVVGGSFRPLPYSSMQGEVTADQQSPATILVVDDNETIRDLLAQSLRAVDYHVLTAEHGAIALAILDSTPVDLVLLDVMMPVMDGLRTCLEIRKRSTLPIIFLSSVKDAAVTAQMHKLGANAYLPKASNQADLLACIHSLLV